MKFYAGAILLFGILYYFQFGWNNPMRFLSMLAGAMCLTLGIALFFMAFSPIGAALILIGGWFINFIKKKYDSKNK